MTSWYRVIGLKKSKIKFSVISALIKVEWKKIFLTQAY